jgi:hypothetical protein
LIYELFILAQLLNRVIQHFTHSSDLQKWHPTLADIQMLPKQIAKTFATTTAAESMVSDS